MDMDLKNKINLPETEKYTADTYRALDPRDDSSPQLWGRPQHQACAAIEGKFNSVIYLFIAKMVC